MSPRLATTAATTSTRTTMNQATWVWRDASSEGLVPGAAVQSGPPPRGCF